MNKNANLSSLSDLLNDLPQTGRVEWIGLRPAQKQKMQTPTSIEVKTDAGIVGDRYAGRTGKQQVTLIQFEHLACIASLLGVEEVLEKLRRNIAVKGINLLALKDKQFRIGNVVLEYTGLCQPCSAMQSALGPGGYNAVRGHGGITARVIRSGEIRLGDEIEYLHESPDQE